MTSPAAARLRAAIAADCPHRLTDYDTHLAAISQPTPAFLHLWRIEHHISSTDLEQQLDQLYRQAEQAADYPTAKGYLEEASRIRAQVRADVIKEMEDA